MRQIKFRGLRIDGKGFAFGLLRKQRERDISQSGNGVAYTGEWEYWIDSHEGEQGSWLVIPESLCQFIGLKDKNGMDIYEGDIIKRNHEYTVKFHKGGWCGVHKDGYFMSYDNMRFDFEVIGNIHTQDGGQEV